jgi:hypothetical protein
MDHVEHTFFPAGHGKGNCDSHGGHISATLERAAKKGIISTLEGYCKVLNDATRLEALANPEASKSVFIAFEPPPKKD